MKLFRKTLAWLLVLLMLFTMVGCQEDVPETTPTEPETTEDTRQEDLAAKYLAAVEALPEDALALSITCEKTVSVGGQSYGESSKAMLDCWNVGQDSFLARVKQDVTFGDNAYGVAFQEVFSGGKVYQSFDNCDFYAELTAEEFMARYVPLQMLDPLLYTLDANEEETVITFDAATAGESWALPEDAALISASGSATLDSAGVLSQTDYTVQYQYGAAQIQLTYEVKATVAGRQPTVPETTDDYVLLSDINAAYALEHAYGYLSQAKHVSSAYKSLVISAAGAMSVINNRTINVYAVGDTYAGRCETHVGVTSYATNETMEQDLDEKFINGKYTASVDGGREETNSAVNKQTFETAMTAILLNDIIVGEAITQAEVTDLGSAILFEYVGSEGLAEAFCETICQTYFGDANALNDMASKYETDTMTCYLALDKYTLLPTALGMKYEGTHTIQGGTYLLSQQIDQSFDLASIDAYEAVFEEPIAEEEPENKAKPLFYHVTGADGQEMWLLGTIHIGDSRTAFLPEEIYNAFYASDALAVECNTEAFSEQVEEDEKLQEQISKCYYYSDNTTAKDHIVTEDLYDSAIQLLKASGNHYFNTEQEMIHLWSSYIDNFYLRQGYSLSSEKGVEKRLLELAEEDDMPVWEVESAMFQIQMQADYSEHLQEVMLYSTMASGAQENWEGAQELYELWCAGDEKALTEEIAGDSTWEIKEEDIDLEGLEGDDLKKAQDILADLENINAQLALLQQEYDKAMMIDRNDGMLEVAKGYLESGDVVFYAVGLAHLLSENGLVNALRDAGYTVELVTYQ